jgi:hypothetical protein
MRPWSGIVILVALTAIAPHDIMTVSAAAVSVLLESLPFIVMATILTAVVGRYAHALIAYTGCGCGAGPSARSIPAAIATSALFGAPIAVGRVLLATLVARTHEHHENGHRGVLGELVTLAPSALLAALTMRIAPILPLHGLHPLLLWCAGALLGLCASPCALGGVALAAALHANAPAAALGVLCTAGIVPGIRIPHVPASAHDSFAYLLFALACALTAMHHGGTLVHPRMTIPLALCAIYCVALAWRYRAHGACATRWIAAAAIAVVIIGAPAPAYRATETTLADAFPGEHVDFTGVAVSDRGHSVLVRYAITCCRADAAPVALALDRDVARYDGRWLRARGTIENSGGALRLHVAELAMIAPPTDPFVYR